MLNTYYSSAMVIGAIRDFFNCYYCIYNPVVFLLESQEI